MTELLRVKGPITAARLEQAIEFAVGDHDPKDVLIRHYNGMFVIESIDPDLPLDPPGLR